MTFLSTCDLFYVLVRFRMSLLRGASFCIAAFSQCVFACELIDIWAPETPLPKSLALELNEALSVRGASSRDIVETRKRDIEEWWMASADVDVGLMPDGTYRVRHIQCDYKSDSKWVCDEHSGRYIRDQYRLVEIEESMNAYDAKILMQKIDDLVGAKGIEADRPLNYVFVQAISHLRAQDNKVLASVREGCGIEIVFRRECSALNTCELVYERTEEYW